MTKQFLGRLQVHACRTKVRRKRVSETVPSDHLVLNASAFQGWWDRLLQHHVRRKRFLAVQPDGGKEEVAFSIVLSSRYSHICEARIHQVCMDVAIDVHDDALSRESL
jgi:hypothetical protein